MPFRFILTQWLAGQAGEAVRAELNERMEKYASNEDENDSPVDLGCVFPNAAEAGGLFDLLDAPKTTSGNGMRFHVGSLGEFRIAIVESGLGAEKAVTACVAMLDVFRPGRVLAAGFATGLDPKLPADSILVPERIINALDRREWVSGLQGWNNPQNRDGLYLGKKLLSLPEPPSKPTEKRKLFEKFHVEMADTDSFAISQLCQSRNVPFLAMKIVLNAADDEIPTEVRHISKQSDKPIARKLGATLGAIFNRPSSALDMLKMQERSLLASDKLGKEIKKSLICEE